MSSLVMRSWLQRRRHCSRSQSQRPQSPRCRHAQPAWCAAGWRPRVELLEDRVYPGDILLGLWAVTLGGPAGVSWSEPAICSPPDGKEEWPVCRVSTQEAAGSLPGFVFLPDAAGTQVGGRNGGDRIAGVASLQTSGGLDLPLFADGSPARQATVELLGTVLGTGIAVGGRFARHAHRGGDGVVRRPRSVAGCHRGGERLRCRAPAACSAAALAVSSAKGRAALSFNAAIGQLTVQPASGGQTVQEGVTAGGFVDVTLNGQHHSSNPAAASFDLALAGATANTVTGIRFQGSGPDTLVLGSQEEAGSLLVQAGSAYRRDAGCGHIRSLGHSGREHHRQWQLAG